MKYRARRLMVVSALLLTMSVFTPITCRAGIITQAIIDGVIFHEAHKHKVFIHHALEHAEQFMGQEYRLYRQHHHLNKKATNIIKTGSGKGTLTGRQFMPPG